MSPPTDAPVGGAASSVPSEPERTVVGLIRAVQAGEVTGPSLTTPDRRRVIEHLWTEGYSVPETAEVLKVSEWTVQRDRKSIREANAVQRSPELVGETVGALIRQADAVVARLRRISRERDTPPSSRVEAEKACWTVTKELAEVLQSLGYLPAAPTEIRGELTHTLGPGLDQMSVEITQLETLLGEAGPPDPALLGQLAHAKQELERLRLAGAVQVLGSAVAREGGDGR